MTYGVYAEGQVLDNTYRVVRLIGEGGMGVVYEATHARLAGRYAIKVLLRKLSDNPEALARFNREARITSSLQHPNIVQVIDFNTDADGTEYLVMEYLKGETLAQRLARRGTLPLEMVEAIVEQVAAGLAAAHSHRVVHRDLKPDNIFLVPVEGRRAELAKVLDFGISKVKDANHGLRGPESALMGTPQYMSPEQCQGRTALVDATTDQFALAVITYEMLTGRPPFCGDSVGTVLSQVLYADPPPMEVEPEIERVVRRGLAKSQSDRFPSVTAFATALREVVDARRPARVRTGEGVDLLDSPDASGSLTELAFEASERATRREPGRPRRRRHWGAVVVAGVAVTLALSFVVGAKKLGHDRDLAPLPPPLIREQRIVDLKLQPPQLPSLTPTTTSVPAVTRAPSTARVEPPEHPAAPGPVALPVFVEDGAARPIGAVPATHVSPPAFQPQPREPREREEDLSRNQVDRIRAEVRRAAQGADRRTGGPGPSSPSAPPHVNRSPSRSGKALDDDAILPLDETFGDTTR